MRFAEPTLQRCCLCRGEAESVAIAIQIGRIARPGCVIALYGELGAGKTRFAQGVASGLGVTEPVTSPTFTLLNEYRHARFPFFHVDCYRLGTDGVETFILALDEWMGEEGVVVIEWAERLQAYLPPEHLQVDIEPAGENKRWLHFTAYGRQAVELLRQLKGYDFDCSHR